MTNEQIAVVRALMSASKKCANTYMRAIDTLESEKRPVPAVWNKACNRCFGAATAYAHVLELAGEKQLGLLEIDGFDKELYQMLIEKE